MVMNQEQEKRMRSGQGFVAALDQSGGSTPKALAEYGISRDQYSTDDDMFNLVHAMRTRVITSPFFSSRHIIGAILFEQTADRLIENRLSGDYLWDVKGIVPFLKVDKGLSEPAEGVQLMKPITVLDELLEKAKVRRMFGTKTRSMIRSADPAGIRHLVEQQFEVGRRILTAGLVPILEPEVDIHSLDKAESERILKAEILRQLADLSESQNIILKLSIPDQEDFYRDLIRHPRVMRVVALSGGYTRQAANQRLTRNHGLTASFSRALLEGLKVSQTDNEFNSTLKKSIEEIYQASIT
jgi:fructose-bisphosphate aldolase, class I